MGKPSVRTKRDALKISPFFSAMAVGELTTLAAACEARAMGKGERIFSPTEPAERFFIVISGRVKVYKLSPRGDEQILHLYHAGHTFGEAAMFAGIHYPAYAETLCDTELIAVPRAALDAAVRKKPRVAMVMLAGLSAKLREFADLIEQLSLKEVPARVAAELLTRAAAAESDAFKLTGSKSNLAARLGIAPETLSRTLGRFKSQGLIEVKGLHFTLLDIAGLETLAENG